MATETTNPIQEAIEMVEAAWTLWSVDASDRACDALGVRRLEGQAYFSDPPGTFKGLTVKVEGEVCVAALTLGDHACRQLALKPNSYNGRGSQGREYGRCLRKHFGLDPA